MRVRDTVFDSRSEDEVFRSLRSRWASRFALYPSLPLSKLIEISDDDLTREERSFFYKTNVDYTLCEVHSNKPVLSMEFDGIGGGFSRNGVYVPELETPDPFRKRKMDLKLRVAQQAGYPFVVVSYEETERLDEKDCLTILDGIIGQVIAYQETLKLLHANLKEMESTIASMAPWERQDFFQDLVTSAEVDAELNADPVVRKAAEYHERCAREGVVLGCRYEPLHDPPSPEFRDFLDTEGLQARIRAIKGANRIGYRVVVETLRIPVIAVAWVRNIEACGVYAGCLAKNIAEYLAFKRTYDLIPYVKARRVR